MRNLGAQCCSVLLQGSSNFIQPCITSHGPCLEARAMYRHTRSENMCEQRSRPSCLTTSAAPPLFGPGLRRIGMAPHQRPALEPVCKGHVIVRCHALNQHVCEQNQHSSHYLPTSGPSSCSPTRQWESPGPGRPVTLGMHIPTQPKVSTNCSNPPRCKLSLHCKAPHGLGSGRLA